MNSNYSMPMNLGNPDEYTIEQFAIKIKNLVGEFEGESGRTIEPMGILGSQATLVYKDPVVDDPRQRRPDITLAKSWLGWAPKVERSIDCSTRNLIVRFRSRWMMGWTRPSPISVMNFSFDITANATFSFPPNGCMQRTSTPAWPPKTPNSDRFLFKFAFFIESHRLCF